MAIYKYQADDRAGQRRQGEVEAASEAEARAKLARRRLRLVSLAVRKDTIEGGGEGKAILGNFIYLDSRNQLQFSLSGGRTSVRDIIVFSKQFATMLSSGVPMVQALGVLAKQQKAYAFRVILHKVQKRVENGSTLSTALAGFPREFDRLYVAMVEAGEASGNLDNILLKVVVYMERAEKIRRQVKSALLYPSLVFAVAVIVVTALLLYVVPMFAQQYQESGQTLPELTQMTIDLSNFIADQKYLMAGALVMFAVFATLFVRSKEGRRQVDRAVFFIPVVGEVLRKIAISRFCSTLASMLSSGVNLLEALNICAGSAGNTKISDFVLGLRRGLEKGEKLSEPLSKGGLFPEMVVSMVAVGEATGAIDDMLFKVSEFYEEEVELSVQTMLSLIEPVMIIVVGSIVGFIVVAMYLPVFDMAGNIN